jgi:(1->4)-alpha-D-glucan 1-alpha-D-glucosylmutase
VQGLRIDHIDGLSDPMQYCRWLQQLIRTSRPGRARPYVVVEKILADGEHLPQLAGVAGTTGYEWLNVISRVLVDGDGLQRLTRTWHEASGDRRSFDEVLLAAKREVMTNVLGSERAALLRLLAGIAAGQPATRDYAGDRLRAAFDLFILHFPVYRTYVTAAGAAPGDREIIKTALAKARAEWIGADAGIFDFLHDALTLGHAARVDPRLRPDVRRFAAKVQQFTGPMMAKSLEDTAFYRYHRLLALNEVGGDPAAEPLSVADFHARTAQRAAAPAQGLTATATHDTKRGEDARARLLALSELADDWAKSVEDWRTLNAGLVSGSERARCPSRAHEYMLYQALLGAWPLDGVDPDFVARMVAYAVKAAREGKEATSWLAPDETYETGLRTFLTQLLDPGRSQRFIESFDAFARRTALLGALNSLVQVTLKTTMPGVPDIYQGSELWDLSLVDPDNRRPVDFAGRATLLESLRGSIDWAGLAAAWPDGRIKLALTHRLLEVRRIFAELFATGSYHPFEVTGPHRDDVIAFARIKEPDAIIVACGRRFALRTQYGKQWPSGRDWQAAVSLRDFTDLEDLLGQRAKSFGSELNPGEMFEPLPIACLRARCSSHTAG